MVTIFGRETPVEMEFRQVQKLELRIVAMAKKVNRTSSSCTCPAGQATPAPPGGPGPWGSMVVNIMDFCKAFNARTQKDQAGIIIPVVKSRSLRTARTRSSPRTPPASFLLKQPGLWSQQGLGRAEQGQGR